MTDIEDLLERVSAHGQAQARPPALVVLRRRRARRRAARAGVGMTALAGVAAVAVLLVPRSGPSRDVVGTDPAPSTPPAPAEAAVPIGPGQVALPARAVQHLQLPEGPPAVAARLSSFATEDGPLVTAGWRSGDRLCRAVFIDGAPGAPGGGASCDALTMPAYRSDRLDLQAASRGPSAGEPVDWLVLTGSAPAGTRTVVLTASGGAQERISVTGAAPAYLERAFFALPWLQQDTVVEALDAGGRRLATDELLLGMGQPPD